MKYTSVFKKINISAYYRLQFLKIVLRFEDLNFLFSYFNMYNEKLRILFDVLRQTFVCPLVWIIVISNHSLFPLWVETFKLFGRVCPEYRIKYGKQLAGFLLSRYIQTESVTRTLPWHFALQISKCQLLRIYFNAECIFVKRRKQIQLQTCHNI